MNVPPVYCRHLNSTGGAGGADRRAALYKMRARRRDVTDEEFGPTTSGARLALAELSANRSITGAVSCQKKNLPVEIAWIAGLGQRSQFLDGLSDLDVLRKHEDAGHGQALAYAIARHGPSSCFDRE